MPSFNSSIAHWLNLGRKLILLFALFTLLLALPQWAFSQGIILSGQAVDRSGVPIPFAQVTVCPGTSLGVPCSPPAAIYSDPTLSPGSQTSNPVSADQNGFYTIYAATGYYIIQIPVNGTVTYSYAEGFVLSGPGSLFGNFPAYNVFANCTASPAPPTNCLLNANMIPSTLNSTTFAGNVSITGTLGVTGMSTLNSLSVTNGALIGGTLGVTGATTLSSLHVTTNELVDGTLGVTGITTLSTVNVTTVNATIVNGGTVNATTGYTLSGTAPLNHLLLGNGTDYVDAATIPASVISGLTLFYQTVAFNGTGFTQRPELNFSTAFVLSDSASPARTNVDLTSIITPGSCTFCNLAYDANGRITAASSATGGAQSLTSPSGYATMPGGLIWQWTQGTGQVDEGDQTVSLPLTFPHACLSAATTNFTTGSDTGEAGTWRTISCNTTTAVVSFARNADHSGNTNFPVVWALGW